MSFTLLDVIFLVFILIIAIVAASKGFLDAIFGKLCWILGLLGAFTFYKKLSKHMINLISNQTVSSIVCFVLIFMVIFLFVKIIQTILGKVFDGEIMKGLDKSLGFFFGLLEGVVVIYIIIFLLIKQPWFDVSKLFEGSMFVKLFGPLFEITEKAATIPQGLPNA